MYYNNITRHIKPATLKIFQYSCIEEKTKNYTITKLLTRNMTHSFAISKFMLY